MKVYFNDDTIGINIISCNYNWQLATNQFIPYCTFNVNSNESVESIISRFENVTITQIQIKNNSGDLIKNMNNLNLKIINIDEAFMETSTTITLTLNT